MAAVSCWEEPVVSEVHWLATADASKRYYVCIITSLALYFSIYLLSLCGRACLGGYNDILRLEFGSGFYSWMGRDGNWAMLNMATWKGEQAMKQGASINLLYNMGIPDGKDGRGT